MARLKDERGSTSHDKSSASVPAQRLREAAEWIARDEPKLSAKSVLRHLWASIWNGEFDGDGLLLLEDGGKQRPYTRGMLAFAIHCTGPHHPDLEFNYRPARPRRGALPDTDAAKVDWAKVDWAKVDWAKLASWPPDAYGLLSKEAREIYIDRVALSAEALGRWRASLKQAAGGAGVSPPRKDEHVAGEAATVAPARHPGGRPPKYGWDALGAAFGAWLHEEPGRADARPKIKYGAVRDLAVKLEMEPPDDRSCAPYVKIWVEAYRRAWGDQDN